MTGRDETGYIIVLVTAGSSEAAAALARTLVEERLAACGNVLGPIRSIYRWQGKVMDDPEALLILKSREELFEALKTRVLELHSYEVPEIIALTVVAGHKDYLDWISDCTSRT